MNTTSRGSWVFNPYKGTQPYFVSRWKEYEAPTVVEQVATLFHQNQSGEVDGMWMLHQPVSVSYLSFQTHLTDQATPSFQTPIPGLMESAVSNPNFVNVIHPPHKNNFDLASSGSSGSIEKLNRAGLVASAPGDLTTGEHTLESYQPNLSVTA